MITIDKNRKCEYFGIFMGIAYRLYHLPSAGSSPRIAGRLSWNDCHSIFALGGLQIIQKHVPR